jgi:hypothetical protein
MTGQETTQHGRTVVRPTRVSSLSALIATAILLDGILAGASLDRTFIQLPAFRRVGPLAWAAFSRNADLGKRALFWYPGLAIGGTALSVIAALKGRRETLPSSSSAWLTVAALLSAAGLLTTIGAAPNMLRLPQVGDDTEVLQRSMEGFQFWQRIRGPLQGLAFVANVLSLLAMRRRFFTEVS